MKAILAVMAVYIVGCSKVEVVIEQPRVIRDAAQKASNEARRPPPTRVVTRPVYVPMSTFIPSNKVEKVDKPRQIYVAPAYRLSPLEAMTPTERERHFRELQILNPPVIYR